MSMTRRTVLSLATAASAGALIGPAAPALARTAPTRTFPLGVRQFTWSRAGRTLVTRIFYPAASGAPGGDPVGDAPVADGRFPVVEWSHGLGGNPESYGVCIRPLAAAGFIVAAPVFPTTTTGAEGNVGDVYNGNQSKDVSEVITRTLALGEPGSCDPFEGRMDTTLGVGAAGHSLGGMTTHGLLTAWPDSRVTAAIPYACVDMGDPTGAVNAKTLFVHGDQDPICQYSLARQAYAELPPAKAFMTHTGQGHDEFIWNGPTYDQTVKTSLDWMRWALYGDTAARDRLASDASGGGIVWEADL
ncbi:alpha/beta hydrolase [Glycomyces sp. TRM65418]|uniref:alpha/beta hydrolase family protein n=1 Tax=Glycomyces sp. TRM65418 TaxID=2867006 RepID=UPI001CE58544|nr:alpha/beta hydrolase [Glycomyces sp. TRM65418]MCC3761748.1 alpha/beta hydrolase [Glycomyces sp. TRM65418]QZD55833.1 alpha/beta hydrolase [Glycomyces sp. TRM65418]